MQADSQIPTPQIVRGAAATPHAQPRPVARPIRIEPAFDDRKFVRALFDRHAPYRAVAAHLPDGSDDAVDARPGDGVNPWFRETWAIGGRPQVEGAAEILHNPRFIAAAHALFPSARIVPTLVVVNLNAPMSAGVPHVDVPVLRGIRREQFALRLQMAMGASALFERWRVIQAGAIAWFYDGPNGGFDYWPDGPAHTPRTESAPFGNLALVADTDRMYHRIGRIGAADAVLPRMSASAEMRVDDDGGWSIFEQNECRARYPAQAVRLSIVWKAEAQFDDPASAPHDALSAPRVFQILHDDLRGRGVCCPTDPGLLHDPWWIERVYRLYMALAKTKASPAQ